MTTMNISLSDALKSFVDEQVARHRYGSTSEYVRDLIRHDMERASLHDLLLEGARSEVAGEVDGAYFDTLRTRARRTSDA